MIPKQDRTPVRTPAHIEQKYNLDQNIDEVLKVATNANRTASTALSTAKNADSVATSAKTTADSTAQGLNAVSQSVTENAEAITEIDKRVETLEKTGGSGGNDGATFTPSVDADGNLSWTNDKGLENPETVNLVDAVLAALPDGDEVSY